MFKSRKHEALSIGSVLFRGNLPPRAEEFEYLKGLGVSMERDQVNGAHWGLKLRHPQWGEAKMMCMRDIPAPPREQIDFTVGMSETEREEARAGRMTVSVCTEPVTKNVLHDRKNLLRYLGAVMGSDGAVAVDHSSWRFWSRAALDEELVHGADLDISSLYCVHAVCDDESTESEGDERPRVKWLHTHGLDHIGAFDFDILDASPEAIDSIEDVLRSIAFAVAEGELGRDTASFTVGYDALAVRMVPAAEFQRRAPAAERALRDATDHVENRSVVCEPVKGLLARLTKGVRASEFFKKWDGRDMPLRFSETATEMMAMRARGTLEVLRSAAEEFKELELPLMVKMGYEADMGDGRGEHLWFSVHSIGTETLDCTLENEPFNISTMKRGDRGEHPIERLTDWMVMTPAGNITPRSLWAARVLRSHWEEIMELHRQARDGDKT